MYFRLNKKREIVYIKIEMSIISVYKKKLLELNYFLDNINFSLGNKREYIIGNYHDLVLNNNLHLNIIFEANVYKFSPNKKCFYK